MASRKREAVVGMEDAIAEGLAVVPAHMGIGAGTSPGVVAMRAAVDPPLSVAAQTWRVVERAWVDGKRVVARDPSGAALTGLSRDEARGYARARPAEVEAEQEP